MKQYNKNKYIVPVWLLLFLFISLSASELYASVTSKTLSWMPPTTNSNGTPLLNPIYGYKLYYGKSSRSYTNVIDVGNKTSYTVSDLSVGIMYYFSVTAYDISGNESQFSSEISNLIALSTNTPNVNFGGNMTAGTAPLAVNFTASIAGGSAPFTYAWDFDNSGGAADSTLQNPSCIFNNKISGGPYPPYTVKLTVSDSYSNVGSMTKTSYISVCYSNVNLIGSTKTYNSLQSAYNVALDGNTIQSRAAAINENINFNSPKAITITGGYNCDHSSIAGKTVINGNMMISNGKVTMGNVTIQ